MSPALHEGALPLVPPGKPSVLLSLILLRFIHLHCFECQYFDCVDHNKLENSEAREQPKCPPTGEQIKMWCIYTMDVIQPLKRME